MLNVSCKTGTYLLVCGIFPNFMDFFCCFSFTLSCHNLIQMVSGEGWKMHNRLVLPHASPKKKPHVSLYAVFVLSNSLKLQAQLLRALRNDCTISGLPSLQSKLETYEGVTELLGKVAHWKFFTFQSGVSIRGSGHILLSSLWFPQDNWVHNVFGKINVKTSCLFILNSRLHWYCSCLE